MSGTVQLNITLTLHLFTEQRPDQEAGEAIKAVWDSACSLSCFHSLSSRRAPVENESCLCSSAVSSREGRKTPTLLHSKSPLGHEAWLSPRDVIHLPSRYLRCSYIFGSPNSIKVVGRNKRLKIAKAENSPTVSFIILKSIPGELALALFPDRSEKLRRSIKVFPCTLLDRWLNHFN